ncbi:hypothetical protein ACMD2_21573 [Ananas comosus]|uniref:Late embryogenesis abundant protein LEA-2 subgroup domain-containing protein n=1 Tax=Ananas comosus TaxID=4615 RepID=A0A199W7L3_ANACO|nr:hypothetical protein ACMD2_21573 [Ananas comosus]
MDKSPDRYPRSYHHPRRGGGGGGGAGAALGSCAAAALFLVVVAAGAAAAVFVVFRPREPTIAVAAIRLPGYAAANGTARFTFAQYAAVRNPNRAAFSHYDSSIRLVYAGGRRQAGFMFIPAGLIPAGRTQYMAASFAVESRMRVKGRVAVLRFFTHHVETESACRVGVSTADGAVVGFRC